MKEVTILHGFTCMNMLILMGFFKFNFTLLLNIFFYHICPYFR